MERQELAYKLVPGGIRVLDVGCNYGGLIFRLIDKYKYVNGVDIQPKCVNRIKKQIENTKNDKRINVKVGDVNKGLDYADGFFDTIIALSIVEHLFTIH